MPTAEQYASSIVEKYRVVADSGSPSHRAADELIVLISRWAKPYLQGITLSGAYAKGTAISLSSHVDVLVLLNPVPNKDLRYIFWNLFEYLTDQNLRAHTRDVSIQVSCKDLNVDLIPSCRDGSKFANLLFNKRVERSIQTTVGQHVHLIANSGRQQEICALKIWRERKELDFPSLYLELITLHALENERFGHLTDNVHAVLRYIANRIEHAVIVDPANPGNVVSEDLSRDAKQVIAKAAYDGLYEDNWKKILW